MTPFALSGLLIIVTCVPLGLIVLLHQPHRALNRAYALFFAVGVGVWGAGSFAGGLGLNQDSALMVWKLAHVGIVFIPIFFYHVVCLVCNLQRAKAVVSSYLFGAVALSLILSGLLTDETRYVFNSFYYIVASPAYFVFFACWIGIVAWAHLELWKGYKSANGIEKKRMQLFLVGVLVGFAGGSMNFLPMFNIDVYPWGNFSIPISALIQAYAIFVYKFLDVEIVVRKTLVYSLLAGLITATYLVMVLIMEKGFQGFFGYRSIVATVVVGFVIAICFNPLRDRIQAFLDRALFKGTTAELAAQREQLLAEVRKSEQMKAVGTLAAGLAHEIKNPLASIKTFTECLDQKHSDPAFLEKFKRIVGGEVERINLIVQQLLDFAKPVPPKLAPVDLGHLLDTTLELLNSEILQRHVEVKRVYGTNKIVLGDPQQLEQVFLNLLLNSLQALNGRGALEVRTDLQASDLRVTIADNGPGIDPDVLPRIFEPFFTTKETGTGLGLAVVQGVVKEHGGRVVVASQPGTGTTVQVYLPAAV